MIQSIVANKTYPDNKELEFYTDYLIKFDTICSNLPEFALTLKPVEDFFNTIDATENEIIKSASHHPSWEWCSKLAGSDPVKMAKILGHIRFWPPQNNEINSSTEKPRWAHSRAAVLMFCGLGTFNENYDWKQTDREPNSRLRSLVFDQIQDLIIAGGKYQKFFDYEKEKKLKLGTNEQNAHMAAKKATAILFINHLWEITRTNLDMEIYPIYHNLKPDREEFHNPLNMID